MIQSTRNYLFNNSKQSLPEVFKLIVENDKKISEIKKQDVIVLEEAREVIKNRIKYIQGAEKYIEEAKKER